MINENLMIIIIMEPLYEGYDREKAGKDYAFYSRTVSRVPNPIWIPVKINGFYPE